MLQDAGTAEPVGGSADGAGPVEPPGCALRPRRHPRAAALAGTARSRGIAAGRGLALAALLSAAVVVVLLALALAGSADAPLLGDPGVVVRWALPTTTVLADLAGAVTLGALVLAAFVLPRGTGRAASDGSAWATAAVIACAAGVVWTVLGVVRLVLTYANVAGRPVGRGRFGAELALFVTDITLGRILLWVVAVAAATSVVALLVTRAARRSRRPACSR